jgi:NAD(P)-dependent dehydrogenase (short-subunit alcohol dehydrogenase family)
MIQAAVPVMPQGGRIINIGSIASKIGVAPIALYGAAKAANDALTYALAMDVCSFPRSSVIALHLPSETDGNEILARSLM